MKTTVSQNKNQQGNVLIIAISVMGVAGLMIGSFLTMTSGQNTSVARSQNWNASIPIVEAGIEEALTHLNDNCTYTDISHPSTNWDADGWSATDIGVRKTTTLPGGSYYTVDIVTASPYSQFNPAVVSEGHVAAPFGAALGAPSPFLAAITTQTTSDTSLSTNVARKVSVTCGASALFAKGLVAKQSIDMNGNPVQTDSFDSSDPAYSTGGLYDVTKHKANGDVATVSGLVNSVNVGNANIDGHISTGPGGSVAIGPNGSVGDLAWQASHTGVEPGYFADDMNVYFPDVKAPFTGGFSTPLADQTVTNASRAVASTTNTTTTWPAGQDPIITNTVTVTTTTFPTAGTYLGTPTMNTARTTTTTLPAAGTYTGTIVTNTANLTSTSVPSSDTYIGTPVTNTTSTTTATYPGSSTYIGLVITNTTTTTSVGYPATGTYVGAVTVNCSSTLRSTKDAPAAGTYCGTPVQTGNGNNNSSAWNWYPISGYTYAKITGYTYNQISGYTYQGISSYTYDLISGWTWAQIVSYTYYGYSTTMTGDTAQHYDWVLDSGSYELSTLSGNVLVRGNAVLYVTDDINTQSITINSGASLKLYTSAPSVQLSGNGVWNAGGIATNFMYYGLPQNQSLKISGNGSFTGVLYAPEAALALKGGGSDPIDFIGASVTKTAVLDGHFKFHYDESLKKSGPSSSYAIQSWNEIPLTQRY